MSVARAQREISSLEFVEWIAFRQLKARPERLERPPEGMDRVWSEPKVRPSDHELLRAAKGMGAVILQPEK